MFESKQSQVAKAVLPLGLKEPVVAPMIIEEVAPPDLPEGEETKHSNKKLTK